MGLTFDPCHSSQYPYETLFRSQHYALLDNGCREFLFLCDFFMVAGNSGLDLFNSIMGKTLSMFLVGSCLPCAATQSSQTSRQMLNPDG